MNRQEILDQAALPTRQRLEEDALRASPELMPVFRQILKEFLDEEFGRDSLPRLSRRQLRLFRSQVEKSPSAYITEARLETATRLLCDTELSVAEIGLLVGYSDVTAFRMAFKRRLRRTPQEFRRRSRQAEWPAELRSLLHWRRIQRSEMTQEARLWLARWLRRRRRRERLRPDQHSDRLVAEVFWEMLSAESPDSRRDLVRREILFDTPVFFHLLGEKSLELGRKSQEEGIEVAELALISLEPYSKIAGRAAVAELRALGWARLGNARRLDGDLESSDRAFRECHRHWNSASDPRDLQILVELLDLEASLRIFQRRFSAAMDLLSRSIALGRATTGDLRRLIGSLLQRVAILVYQDHLQPALEDLASARELLSEVDAPYLELIVYQDLAGIYALTGEHERARASIVEARRRCQSVGTRFNVYQLDWIEGQISRNTGNLREAHDRFEEARAGFLQQHCTLHHAAVCLDLASLYLDQNRYPEASRLATEAFVLFESYQVERETLGALELLREALLAGHVTDRAISRAKDAIVQRISDPSRPLKLI